MEANKVEIKPFIVSILTIVVIEVGAGVLFSEQIRNSAVVLSLLRVLEIILLLTIVGIWSRGLSDIGLEKSGILPGLWRGLLWSIAFGVIVTLFF